MFRQVVRISQYQQTSELSKVDEHKKLNNTTHSRILEYTHKHTHTLTHTHTRPHAHTSTHPHPHTHTHTHTHIPTPIHPDRLRTHITVSLRFTHMISSRLALRMLVSGIPSIGNRDKYLKSRSTCVIEHGRV